MTTKDAYLDAGMRGYIFNIAKRNLGRIANYDLEDLIQEGYACYYKCRSRYVGGAKDKVNRYGVPCRYLPPDNPDKVAIQHFNRLVQTAFANRISDLAFRQPKGWELPITDLAGDMAAEAAWEAIIPAQDEEATIGLLLQNAPREIKQLLDLLINDCLDFQKNWVEYRRLGKGTRHSRRESTNQRFCRLLGLPSERDIRGELEQYFHAVTK